MTRPLASTLPEVLDLTLEPAARRVSKKPIPVDVVFASAPGTLQTLEGPVQYQAGDALVTAATGESWPISRAKFLARYVPVVDTDLPSALNVRLDTSPKAEASGARARWLKRPAVVLGLQLKGLYRVKVGHADNPLVGQSGDWLVQYGHDATGRPDQGIVSAAVFAASYDVLPPGDEQADTPAPVSGAGEARGA